ncbi:MAG: hypothetical protein LBE08_04450 [Bifidobacteriaceae bacterium]|jgi:hypothetical protein|nr:hypothetical protein [Bifidobacteriaceae bacterium]
MLQICRHYRPDAVTLYLSDEIAGNEDSDQRYTRAIRLLAGELREAPPEIVLVRSACDAHRFDEHIADFRRHLSELARRWPDAELLLNVSSGTPQMQSALFSLHAFDLFRSNAIQVLTPRKAANRGDDRESQQDYELDTLWELNPDRTSGENRCREVASPNLSRLILTNSVKELILSYDYTGALSVARRISEFPDSALRLIDGAQALLELDETRACRSLANTAFALTRLPGEKLALYLAGLEVRLLREQWTDFVRAVTPAVFETLAGELARVGVARESYLRLPESVLNADAVRLDPDLTRAFGRLLSGQGGKHVYSTDLLVALESKSPENPNLAALDKLVTFESGNGWRAGSGRRNQSRISGVRNLAAHALVKLTAEDVSKRGGIAAGSVMHILYTLNRVKPGRFTRLNQGVLNALDSQDRRDAGTYHPVGADA